jgi:hypothetical protein
MHCLKPSTTNQNRQSVVDCCYSGNIDGQESEDVCLEEKGESRQTEAYVCGSSQQRRKIHSNKSFKKEDVTHQALQRRSVFSVR